MQFHPGQRVLIKRSAGPSSYPVSVGIVESQEADGSVYLAVAPTGERLPVASVLVEDLERPNAERRLELAQQFRELSAMFRGLADNAETNGMLGPVQQALAGMGLCIYHEPGGKIVVEAPYRVGNHFQSMVAQRMMQAGLRMVGCRDQTIGGELPHFPCVQRLTFKVRHNA